MHTYLYVYVSLQHVYLICKGNPHTGNDVTFLVVVVGGARVGEMHQLGSESTSIAYARMLS